MSYLKQESQTFTVWQQNKSSDLCTTHGEYFKIKQDVFVKHYMYVPGGNKVRKSYYCREGHSKGHKVIDLESIWKGLVNG